MVGGSAALYQAVIVLIPAILFGGAMLEVRRSSSPDRLHWRVGLGLLLLLGVGVWSEVLAIGGAIEPGSVSGTEQRILGSVVIFGTAALAVWTVLPLFGPSGAPKKCESCGNVKTEEKLPPPPILAAGAAVVVAATIIGGMVGIGGRAGSADARVKFEAASQRRVDSQRDLFAAEDEVLAASASLIRLARSTPHPGVAEVEVLTELARLREGVLGVMRGGLTDQNLRSRVARAHENLRTIVHHLRVDFLWRIKDVTAVEEKMLTSAGMRVMIGSYGAVGAAAEHARALLRIRAVCAERKLSWECASAS